MGIAGVLCIVVGANHPTSRAAHNQNESPKGCSVTDKEPISKLAWLMDATICSRRIPKITNQELCSIISLDSPRSVAVIPTITTIMVIQPPDSTSRPHATSAGTAMLAPADIRYRIERSSLSAWIIAALRSKTCEIAFKLSKTPSA